MSMDQDTIRRELDERIGKLAWQYRAARMRGIAFDVEFALQEFSEPDRKDARELLQIAMRLFDAGGAGRSKRGSEK